MSRTVKTRHIHIDYHGILCEVSIKYCGHYDAFFSGIFRPLFSNKSCLFCEGAHSKNIPCFVNGLIELDQTILRSVNGTPTINYYGSFPRLD